RRQPSYARRPADAHRRPRREILQDGPTHRLPQRDAAGEPLPDNDGSHGRPGGLFRRRDGAARRPGSELMSAAERCYCMLEEEKQSKPPIAKKLSYCQPNCTYSAYSAADAAEELNSSSNFRQGDRTMKTRMMFLSFCLVMTTMAWAADMNGQYQEDFIS